MLITPRAAIGRRVSAGILLAGGLVGGGCSQGASTASLLELAQKPSLAAATQDKPADARSDLQKATEYWGKEFAKNPRDAKTAVNFARNLKALGEKQQALAVLQQASMFHGQIGPSTANTAGSRSNSTRSARPRSCWSRPMTRPTRTGG